LLFVVTLGISSSFCCASEIRFQQANVILITE